MNIWKNTSTLDGYDDSLKFTSSKKKADIALIGSKSFDLNEFHSLKGIFRAGIGRDNVPEKEAQEKGVVVRFPSTQTTNIIYDETSSFTCSIIFRMLYSNVGTLEPWAKEPRQQLSQKTLLLIGTGRIGRRVAQLMKPFIKVTTFDILNNKSYELKELMQVADCVSIHIPKSRKNVSFINEEKLSWMKNGSVIINTSRGEIVDEDALYKEIQSNRLSSAFDVYWQEPYDGKLKEFHPKSFYMTPHIASTCQEFLSGCRSDLNQLISDITNKSL